MLPLPNCGAQTHDTAVVSKPPHVTATLVPHNDEDSGHGQNLAFYCFRCSSSAILLVASVHLLLRAASITAATKILRDLSLARGGYSYARHWNIEGNPASNECVSLVPDGFSG